MKIVILYKRHNMGIDSLKSNHGRMLTLYDGLRAEGHDVHLIITDYHPKKNNDRDFGSKTPNHTLLPFKPFSFLKHLKHINTEIDKQNPDIILAGSDALQAISAYLINRKSKGIPFFIDLKDNYEYFGATKIPGAKKMLIKSLEGSSGVICVSKSLESYVKKSYRISSTFLLENFVDTKIFKPLERTECRKELGLPMDKFLIGTAGSLTKSRGISILPEAFESATRIHQSSILVVAGHRDRSWHPPRSGQHIDMGFIDPSNIPLLFNALDVGVICNVDSEFGRYCYPQKYCEMLACGLPVIAPDTGIFSKRENHRGVFATFSPSDPSSLKSAIESAYSEAPGRVEESDPLALKQRLAALSRYLCQNAALVH